MTSHAAGHGRHHKLQFSPRARAAIYSVLGATWVTGLGWLVLRHFFRRAGEFGLVPHPLEPWAQRLHGGSAFAALSLMGMLWTTHVVRAWRRHLRPPSGFAVLVVLAALAVTGYPPLLRRERGGPRPNRDRALGDRPGRPAAAARPCAPARTGTTPSDGTSAIRPRSHRSMAGQIAIRWTNGDGETASHPIHVLGT